MFLRNANILKTTKNFIIKSNLNRLYKTNQLNKTLGQHILINPGIIDQVLKKCDISFFKII